MRNRRRTPLGRRSRATLLSRVLLFLQSLGLRVRDGLRFVVHHPRTKAVWARVRPLPRAVRTWLKPLPGRIWRWVRPLPRAVWTRCAGFVRTLGSGPTPEMDEGKPQRAAIVAEASAEPARELPGHGAGDAAGDGGVRTSTVVPAARWKGLDQALGQGRERWRNLVTAGIVVVALIVAVSVLWSSGDEPADQTQAAAEGLVPADPVMALDDELPEQPLLAPEEQVGFAPALDDLPDGVPSAVAYPDEPPADEPSPPARVAESPTAAEPEPEPVVVAVPEPEPDPEPVVSEEDLRRLKRRARCKKGTLPTRVLAGDTIRTIAWRHAGEGARELMPRILAANPRLKPSRMAVGDLVCVPDAERVIVDYQPESYKIRRGDTINGLAARFPHLTRNNVRAITRRARRKDMLFAGARVMVPMPLYAGR